MPDVNPCESRTSNLTKYAPAVVKTCSMVRVEDHGVSQTPSPSQSHRACKVALGSPSVVEEASKATELFTLGDGGANVNRAVSPVAATVTAIDAVCDSVPSVPVTTTVYEPKAVPLSVQADVCVPLMVEGLHDAATPEGGEAAVSSTVPVKPPVACREIVEVAERPEANETDPGFAESMKSGPPELKNSNGDGAVTSPCPRFPPPQTSSTSLRRE